MMRIVVPLGTSTLSSFPYHYDDDDDDDDDEEE